MGEIKLGIEWLAGVAWALVLGVASLIYTLWNMMNQARDRDEKINQKIDDQGDALSRRIDEREEATNQRIETRDAQLNRKIDAVASESARQVEAFAKEARRENEAVREEGTRKRRDLRIDHSNFEVKSAETYATKADLKEFRKDFGRQLAENSRRIEDLLKLVFSRKNTPDD